MKTNQRKTILQNILLEHKDSFMRVSDLRDLVFERLNQPDYDKASLRRWIYSFFRAMEAKGSIEKRKIAGEKKWEYRITQSNVCINSPAKTEEKNDDDSELARSLDILQAELLDRKKDSKVFFSQLSAYKEMEHKHSSLSTYASAKYKETFDKGYELAGVIKALENTLIDHGRSVN